MEEEINYQSLKFWGAEDIVFQNDFFDDQYSKGLTEVAEEHGMTEDEAHSINEVRETYGQAMEEYVADYESTFQKDVESKKFKTQDELDDYAHQLTIDAIEYAKNVIRNLDWDSIPDAKTVDDAVETVEELFDGNQFVIAKTSDFSWNENPKELLNNPLIFSVSSSAELWDTCQDVMSEDVIDENIDGFAEWLMDNHPEYCENSTDVSEIVNKINTDTSFNKINLFTEYFCTLPLDPAIYHARLNARFFTYHWELVDQILDAY